MSEGQVYMQQMHFVLKFGGSSVFKGNLGFYFRRFNPKK